MTDTTSTTTTTTTTTTTPEVEGFVQKIQTWRTTLTPSEQTMLDTILTTAQRTATTGRTTADVTAYTMTTTTNWTTLGTWLTTTARTTRPPPRRKSLVFGFAKPLGCGSSSLNVPDLHGNLVAFPSQHAAPAIGGRLLSL